MKDKPKNKNVVNLSGGSYEGEEGELPPNEEIVSVLEGLLKKALEGELQELCFCAYHQGNTVDSQLIGSMLNPPVMHSMLTSLSLTYRDVSGMNPLLDPYDYED